MTSQSRFNHAEAHRKGRANPLPGLVELLLDLLRHDVPHAHGVRLSAGDDEPLRVVGDPDAGRLVRVSAPVAGGRTVTLEVGADVADEEPTRAQLRRFVPLVVACISLEHQLEEQSGSARDAVTAIERLAVFDLATGIMMARRDCDLRTARDLVTEWSRREGVDLQSVSPADVLGRLTIDQRR